MVSWKPLPDRTACDQRDKSVANSRLHAYCAYYTCKYIVEALNRQLQHLFGISLLLRRVFKNKILRTWGGVVREEGINTVRQADLFSFQMMSLNKFHRNRLRKQPQCTAACVRGDLKSLPILNCLPRHLAPDLVLPPLATLLGHSPKGREEKGQQELNLLAHLILESRGEL